MTQSRNGVSDLCNESRRHCSSFIKWTGCCFDTIVRWHRRKWFCLLRQMLPQRVLSVCLSYSCTLLRPLYGMRCNLAGTVMRAVWSNVALDRDPSLLTGRGDLAVHGNATYLQINLAVVIIVCIRKSNNSCVIVYCSCKIIRISSDLSVRSTLLSTDSSTETQTFPVIYFSTKHS